MRASPDNRDEQAALSCTWLPQGLEIPVTVNRAAQPKLLGACRLAGVRW
jgi:hypothetical protein